MGHQGRNRVSRCPHGVEVGVHTESVADGNRITIRLVTALCAACQRDAAYARAPVLTDWRAWWEQHGRPVG